MTITFSMTAAEVITMAMAETGALALGEAPTAAELADGITRLNLLLKSFAAEGITPWTDIDGQATITGGNASVVLSPRPIELSEARIVISSTNERPLSRWEQADYARLPNKAAVGTPTAYSLRFTSTSVTMRVWPVPSTNMTVKYGYARVIDDVAAGSDTLDVPQMWLKPLIMILAEDFIPATGAARADIVIAQAEKYRRMVNDWDRPASYSFGS
jgi:hypothetical protein